MNEKQSDAVAEFWLLTAAADLCNDARARIAAEITAHYADLVELHLAKGMPLLEARLKALEDLGDARVAARRFRKQHLTKVEEKWIYSLLEFNKMRALVISLVIFVLSAGVFFELGIHMIPDPDSKNSMNKAFALQIAVLFLLFVIFPVISSVVSRRARLQSGVAAALFSDMVAKFALGVFPLGFSLFRNPLRLADWLFFACMSLAGLSYALPTFRLWRKFCREHRKHDKMIEAS